MDPITSTSNVLATQTGLSMQKMSMGMVKMQLDQQQAIADMVGKAVNQSAPAAGAGKGQTVDMYA